MPDELNNIDELIEEYVGREEELLLTLNGMRDGEDPPELPEDFANFDDQPNDTNAGGSADGADFAGDTVVIDVDDGENRDLQLPTVITADDDGNGMQEVNIAEVNNDNDEGSNNLADIENNAGELLSTTQPLSPITNLPPNDGPSDIPGVISAASTGASHSTQMTNNTKDKLPGGGRILFPAHEVTDHGDGDDMTLSTLGNGTVGGKVNNRSGRSSVAPPSSALRGSARSIENSTTDDNNNNRRKKKKRREPLSNRALCIIFTVVIVLIVIVAIVLGVLLGTRNNKSNNNDSNNQDGEFIGREDIPKNDGASFIKDTPPPTPPPAITANTNNKHNDGYNPNDSMSFCNILPPENIQELGITKLQGTYPKVAIDGTQAIIASGSGFVAFYEFNDLRRLWSRTEVFNLPPTVGEISSVAISGNVAVAGAPMSMTNLSEYRDEPLETGAIYIYQRSDYDPGSSSSGRDDAILSSDKWQQFESEVYIPEEYKRSNSVSQYREARFGWSVDIDGDLIVVGAPEENNNRGSATVFRRKDVTNAGGSSSSSNNDQNWEQVRRILPNDLCVAEFFAYSVQVNNDLIAASADCDVILLLYQYERNSATLALTQEMRYVSPKWGTISSISMGWDNLVYSTVNGGLFIYRRGTRTDGTTWYTLEQEMSFDNTPTLFQYPLTVDTTMMSLAAADKVYIYTQDETSRRWKRENIVLTAAGDYTGYIGASVAMSGGHLLIAEKKEVKTHDFTSCAQTESMAPTPNPSKAQTVQPAVSPGSPTCISVSLIFDDNSAETSWEITAADGLSAAKSPVFDELMQDISSPVCLPDGNYAFTIADVAGDGM